jgi:hypothetical protein
MDKEVSVRLYDVPGGRLAIANAPITADVVQWVGGKHVPGRPEARFIDGSEEVRVRAAGSRIWHIVFAPSERAIFSQASARRQGFHLGI